MTPHPLLAVLLDAAAGRSPPVDGTIDVLPPLDGGLECATTGAGTDVRVRLSSRATTADIAPTPSFRFEPASRGTTACGRGTGEVLLRPAPRGVAPVGGLF